MPGSPFCRSRRFVLLLQGCRFRLFRQVFSLFSEKGVEFIDEEVERILGIAFLPDQMQGNDSIRIADWNYADIISQVGQVPGNDEAAGTHTGVKQTGVHIADCMHHIQSGVEFFEQFFVKQRGDWSPG